MILDLKQRFVASSMELPFEGTLSLSDVDLWGTHPFRTPVHLTGKAVNHAGLVTLTYKARFVLHTLCARCLLEEDKEQELLFLHGVVRSLNEEDKDDYICLLYTSPLCFRRG